MKHIYVQSDLYREKIHKLIPGGAHTYSKGDDQFPALAPAAIKKGKGAYVWDLDGNKFLDCSMGLGSVTLGHAYDEINEAVIKTIQDGVNFQRPSYLELETAEKFLEVVDYHDMIKFAKNGSTVTSAAVKLARAFTGRKIVAFPSDHPFYSYDDWFIGAKECSSGVPNEIKKLSVMFRSNDYDSLESIFNQYPDQIACVIMEPEKFDSCNPDFLRFTNEICKKNGTLFIADEMVTGFKVAFPGSCKKHGVVPDMSTWGKGIANGFSFCALTGRREILELGGIKKKGAEKVFLISTTHGGETHALSAVMKTIEIYKRENICEKINAKGVRIISELRDFVHNLNLDDYIKISDSSWTIGFTFNGPSKMPSPDYRTLFMQEMIKNNVLFQGALVPTASHNEEEIKLFYMAFKNSCEVFKNALNEGFEKYLIGESCLPVFRKYI